MAHFPADVHQLVNHSVHHQDITPQLENDPLALPHAPAQLIVQFAYRDHYTFTNVSLNRTTSLLEESDKICQTSWKFDLNKLRNPRELAAILARMLSRYQITRGTDGLYEDIVRKIIVAGLELKNNVSYAGRNVLGLLVSAERELQARRCEICSLERLQEEFLQAVTSNGVDGSKGMVPASESSIRKVLKRVRVRVSSQEEGEESNNSKGKKRRTRSRVSVSESDSCTVCMEKFEGGSYVACMPCSHVFHRKCIVHWLRQSHYCPICRFEVTIDG